MRQVGCVGPTERLGSFVVVGNEPFDFVDQGVGPRQPAVADHLALFGVIAMLTSFARGPPRPTTSPRSVHSLAQMGTLPAATTTPFPSGDTYTAGTRAGWKNPSRTTRRRHPCPRWQHPY